MNIILGLFFASFVIISIYSIVIGITEIIKNHRNPIPKFANGDKRFSEIEMLTFRTIKFNQFLR